MRRLLRILAWALLLAAAAALAAYAVGRTLTDRFDWSQFISWIPGWILLAFALLTGLAAAGARALARRPAAGRGASSRVGVFTWSARGLALVLAVSALHAGWGARLHRALDLRAPAAGAIRLLHWTAMAPDVVPRDSTLPPLIDRFDPDLVLLTMALAPHQYDGLVSRLPPDFHTLHAGIFAVASRYPIVESRMLGLGLAAPVTPAFDPADPRTQPPFPDESRHWIEYLYNNYGPGLGLPRRYFRNADPGTLLVLRLDARAALGRELVVWFIDLPSDPIRSKRDLAQSVLAHLATAGRDPIPQPDFVVGDFNIPAGSASLDTLVRGLRSAFDDAGWGIAATWPRAHPLLRLDHVFRAPHWQATEYRVFDPGSGDHLAQFARLRSAPPG